MLTDFDRLTVGRTDAAGGFGCEFGHLRPGTGIGDLGSQPPNKGRT